MSLRAQQGVALVTALVIVALTATAAALLINQQQLHIRRSANLFNSEQAQQYVLGAEAWAMRTLSQDRLDNDVDSLNEDWATVLPPIDIPGGAVTGYIVDLQGALNLNGLLKSGKVDAIALERTQRLLGYAELDGGSVVQALIDWLDANIEPAGPGGAEDDFYLGLEQPYRAANRPMVSISELRLVRGVTDEAYIRLVLQNPEQGEDGAPLALLRPLVFALPDPTPINVNTAPVPVLMALGLDQSAAEEIVKARADAPFKSVEEFLRHSAVADTDLAKKQDQAADLSVNSSYFLLVAEARIDRARAPLFSVLRREQNGIMHVLMRSQGTF